MANKWKIVHEGEGDIGVGGVIVYCPACSGGFLVVGKRQLSALDTVFHNAPRNLNHTVTKIKPRDGYMENSGLL